MFSQDELKTILLSRETLVVRKRITVDGKRTLQPVEVRSESLVNYLPKCHEFIQLLYNKQFEFKDNQHGYVNLWHKELDGLFKSGTTRLTVLDMLEQLNLIVINHKFVHSNNKSFCKSYKLTEYAKAVINGVEGISYYHTHTPLSPSTHTPISGDGLAFYPYTTNPNTSGLLPIHQLVNANSPSTHTPVSGETLAFYPYTSLYTPVSQIEYEFQRQQILNLKLDTEQIKQDGLNPNTLLPHRFFKLENRVNKVFTHINLMRKEYRKYLRCKDGYSLMEIDFKSSHVLHLLKIIFESSPSNALLDEANRIKDILTNGDIYQFVADQESLAEFELDRAKAKELFIQHFMYGKQKKWRKSKAVKALFPAISDFLDNDRKEMSRTVQRAESRLLNNIIVKRIATEYPSCTLYGVFDALLLDEDHFDQIARIVREESESFFGFEVPLTFNDLNTKYDNQQIPEPEPVDEWAKMELELQKKLERLTNGMTVSV